MKGNCAFFDSYNIAGSKSVKIVNIENEININNNEKHITVPYNGIPNSVIIIKRDGVIHQERYYDEDGLPYLDIDYSDHGNPKQHPVVPHEHHWYPSPTGERKREKKWRNIENE